MKELFDLFASITIDGVDVANKAIAGIDKNAKALSKSLVKTGKEISAIGKDITKFASGPAAGLLTGLGLITTATAEYGDSMMDLKDITGLSTDTLQELEHITCAAGVDFNTLTGAVTKFQGRLSQIIKEGGKAYDTIKMLGVNVFDASGNIRDMNELFPEIINRLQGVENVTTRNMLAQQLFGEGLSALGPVLGLSADEFNRLRKEAHDTGVVLSQEGLQSAAKFKAEVSQMSAQFTKTWQQLAIEFIPVIRDELFPIIQNKVIPAVRSFFKWLGDLDSNTKKTGLSILGITAAIGPMVLGLGGAVKQLGLLVSAIRRLTIALAGNPFVLAAIAIGAIGIAVYKTTKAWQKWKEEIGEKVEAKQVSQMKKDLEEIIPLYNELALMDRQVIGEERFAEVSKKIKELETNLADLGQEFTGSFSSKSLQAENALSDLNLQAKETDQAIQDLENTVVNTNLKDPEEDKSLERRRQYLEDLSNRRYELEKKYTDLVDEQTLNRTQLLEKERDEALRIANETGADKANIEQYYNTEINRIKEQENFEQFKKQAKLDDEYRDRRIENERKVAEYRKNIFQQTWDFIVDGVNKLGSIFSMFTQNRLDEINNEYQAEREAIENSTLGKKEKARQLEELDKEQAEKERALKKKQAAQNKAFSIFNIIIDTAMGIAKIWAQSGVNFIQAGIMSGVLGTISAANIAAVASQPIPMAEGGIIKSKKGGVLVNAAEAGQDEMFIPMKTGVKLLADALLNSISNSIKLPSASFAQGNSTNQAWLRPLNVYVGTWLGDESGIKKLAREITNIQVIESQRVGAIA